MYIKTGLLLFLIITVSHNKAQDISQGSNIPNKSATLELRLQGKKYKQLILYTQYLSNETEQSFVHKDFAGYSKNGYSWLFTIPDSVYQHSKNYSIGAIYSDSSQSRMIAFGLKKLPSSQIQAQVDLPKPKMVIKGVYREEKVIDAVSPDGTSSNLYLDIFNIELGNGKKEKYTELELSLRYPYFGVLTNDNYETELQKRIELVKKYPESNFFLRGLAYSNGYKNRGDMQLVFNNFSDRLKNSYYGQKLKKYVLEEVVPIALDTLKLVNLATNILEQVISDKSKPTLIIFSASWCAPCHKMIPYLKETYKKFSSVMDMVYISIDSEKGEDTWGKLMIKEEIPWPSFFAGDKNSGLSEKYSINSIPYYILVYKERAEQIDVTDLDKNMLHEIVSRNNVE